jgi:hypothetical protein
MTKRWDITGVGALNLANSGVSVEDESGLVAVRRSGRYASMRGAAGIGAADLITKTQIDALDANSLIRTLSADFTFETSSPFDLGGVLPGGSTILGWRVNITTAFDGTTPALNIGDVDTADNIASVAPADMTSAGVHSDYTWTEYDEDIQLFGTLVLSGASQGAGTISVEYITTPQYSFIDRFNGRAGDVLNPDDWDDYADGDPNTYAPVILDGSGAALFRYLNTGDDYALARTDTGYIITDDFDVEVQLHFDSQPPTSQSSLFTLLVQVDGTHFVQLSRGYHTSGGGQCLRSAGYAGGWVFDNYTAYSGISDVRLKISRRLAGFQHIWRTAYWTGAKWATLDTNMTIGSGAVFARLDIYSSSSSAPDWTAKVTELRIAP